MMPQQFDVFLSHSSVDKPWVIKLKDDLHRYGVSVWLDKDEIRPGDIFAKALEQGLDDSGAVVLVVSPEAIESGWVEEEYYRALSLAKTIQAAPLQLIPVILRDAEPPGFLQSRNWVDFRDETTYAQSVWELVWGITGEKPAQVLDLTSPDVVISRGSARRSGLFERVAGILRDPMWGGIAVIVGILACLAAWFVIPEARQFLGLGEPTPLPTPTPTADVISMATATPRGTPVSLSTGTPPPTDVPTSADVQPTTPLSTQTPIPETSTPEMSATSAAGEPEIITIFAGKDSLTVYVPANVTSSLQDLNLEHRRNERVETYFFADSDGFGPYIDGTVSEPYCLHLERASNNTPFPIECRFAHRPTVGLPDGSIFWWDEFTGGTKTLIANLGTERLGTCAAGFSRCSIEIP